MGMIPMRDRDARIRWDRDRARDAGNDLKRNAGLSQRARFLAAAPEHERVATLQSAHILAVARLFDHEPLDMFLLKTVVAGLFADIDDFRVRPRFFEKM